MAKTVKTVPTPPVDFTPQMTDSWRAMCQRLIDAGDGLYKSDLSLIECYCRTADDYRRVTIEAKDSPYSSGYRVGPLHRLKADLAAQVKSQLRALESTALGRERLHKSATGKPGAQPGVRHKPAREGVRTTEGAKKLAAGTTNHSLRESSGISWLDEIRAGKV